MSALQAVHNAPMHSAALCSSPLYVARRFMCRIVHIVTVITYPVALARYLAHSATISHRPDTIADKEKFFNLILLFWMVWFIWGFVRFRSMSGIYSHSNARLTMILVCPGVTVARDN